MKTLPAQVVEFDRWLASMHSAKCAEVSVRNFIARDIANEEAKMLGVVRDEFRRQFKGVVPMEEGQV